MPSGLSLFFGNTFQNISTRTQVLTISCRQQLTLLRAYPGMPYRPLYSLCILNAPSCLHISATLALLFPMKKVQRPGRNQHHQATLSLCPKLLLGATYSHFLHTKFKEKRACSPSLPLSFLPLLSLLLPSPRSMWVSWSQKRSWVSQKHLASKEQAGPGEPSWRCLALTSKDGILKCANISSLLRRPHARFWEKNAYLRCGWDALSFPS